jgi:Protein of unknown function (DUF1761)
MGRVAVQEITADVNWLAVVVGAVLSFLLGWLWYSPALFGKKWAEGVGVELGAANAMPVGAMVAQVVAIFLLAWIFGVTASNEALLTVILVVLAIAAFLFSSGMFAKKSMYAVYTETGYIIAIAVVMFIVQAIL